MKMNLLAACGAWVLAAAPAVGMGQAGAPAMAQAGAPAPASAASVPMPIPATPKAGPRLLTPAESRDSATAPGELRPERRVTPQINVPLGRRTTPADDAEKRPPRASPAPAPATGNIDDAAARCEAQRGEQVRAKCRDDLARQNRTR